MLFEPPPGPLVSPAGLPAGPGGALGAVEGGSWLAALSGIAVLALQVRGGSVPDPLVGMDLTGQR